MCSLFRRYSLTIVLDSQEVVDDLRQAVAVELGGDGERRRGHPVGGKRSGESHKHLLPDAVSRSVVSHFLKAKLSRNVI